MPLRPARPATSGRAAGLLQTAGIDPMTAEAFVLRRFFCGQAGMTAAGYRDAAVL